MSTWKNIIMLSIAMAATATLAQDKMDPGKIERELNQSLAAKASPPSQKMDAGQREYENSCATCHGMTGKGMGPFSDSLKRSPPDLTMLARRNDGVFPLSRIYSTIEGAEASHGTREMPIWGRRYRTRAAQYYDAMEYDERLYVRGRILSLVDYLNRIQEK